MNLDLFNSFSDIQDLINESSSPDGETASFELKGTYGRSTPSKDDKKRFAKEICAFANSFDSNQKSLNWYLPVPKNHLGHLCSRVFRGLVRRFF